MSFVNVIACNFELWAIGYNNDASCIDKAYAMLAERIRLVNMNVCHLM
jgi:hypothetical protein